MAGVTWLNDANIAIDEEIRHSWEINVFHPGELVRVAPDLPDADRPKFRYLLEAAETSRHQAFTVCKTCLAVKSTSNGPQINVSYSLLDHAGFWPHSVLVDARPMSLLYGVILVDGTAGWIVPLPPGSADPREATDRPIQLKPLIERRAQSVFEVERSVDLPPVVGEFMVATDATPGVSLGRGALDEPARAGRVNIASRRGAPRAAERPRVSRGVTDRFVTPRGF